MNDLIRTENGINILDTVTAKKLVEFERKLKALKELEDEIKNALLVEMRDKNIKQIEDGALTISYVFPTDREDFDKKAFKEDHKDLYDEYVKFTPVKDSIRIKVK